MKMTYIIILSIILSASCTGLRLLEEETGSKAIRCFWMESTSYRVFDLKNLKRPLKQN
jgi:hypothetical protein